MIYWHLSFPERLLNQTRSWVVKSLWNISYNPTRRSCPNPFLYFNRIQLTKFNSHKWCMKKMSYLYNILLEYELTRGLELALLILEMCFLNIWKLAPNTGRMLFHWHFSLENIIYWSIENLDVKIYSNSYWEFLYQKILVNYTWFCYVYAAL